MKIKIIFISLSLFLLFGCKDVRKIYYKDGTLKAEIEYKEGNPNGRIVKYYSNGNILAEGQFVNGKKEGLSKFYSVNGQLEMECYYLNDLVEGVIKEYYESGALKVDGTFQQGKQNGITKEYYESGEIKAITMYSDSLRNGECKLYHLNGQLKKDAYYENDTAICYTVYDETGRTIDYFAKRFIIDMPEKFYAKEQYTMRLKLYEPPFTISYAQLDFLIKNKKGELKIDTIIGFRGEDTLFHFSYSPPVAGNYVARGMIFDPDSHGPHSFYYEFEVFDRQAN